MSAQRRKRRAKRRAPAVTMDIMQAATEVAELGGSDDVRVGTVEVVARVAAPAHPDKPTGDARGAGLEAVGDQIVVTGAPRKRRKKGAKGGHAGGEQRCQRVSLALGSGASDAEVFETLGDTVLEWLWEGFNTAVVALGQRGTGKSRVLFGAGGGRLPGGGCDFGDEEGGGSSSESSSDTGGAAADGADATPATCARHGLVARLLAGLFARIDAANAANAAAGGGAAAAAGGQSGVYVVGISCLELLGNRVVDLLDPEPAPKHGAGTPPSPAHASRVSGRAQGGKSPGTGAADAAGSATTLRVASLADALDVLLRLSRARSANWAHARRGERSASGRRRSAVPVAAESQRAHSFVRVVLYNRQQRLVSSLHIANLVGWAPRASCGVPPAPPAPSGASNKRSDARLERLVSRQQAAMAKLVQDLAEVSGPRAQGGASSGSPDRSRRQVVAAAQSSKLNQLLGPLLAGNCKPFVLATLSPAAVDGKGSATTLDVCGAAMQVASACVRLTGVRETDLRLVPLTPAVRSKLLPRPKPRAPARGEGDHVAAPPPAQAGPTAQDAGSGPVLVEPQDLAPATTPPRSATGGRADLNDSLDSPAVAGRQAGASGAPADAPVARAVPSEPPIQRRADAGVRTNGHHGTASGTHSHAPGAPAASPDRQTGKPKQRAPPAQPATRQTAAAPARPSPPAPAIVSEQARAAHAAYAHARAAGGGQYARATPSGQAGVGSGEQQPQQQRGTARHAEPRDSTPPRRSQGTPSSYVERHARGKASRGTPGGLESGERRTVAVSPPRAGDHRTQRQNTSPAAGVGSENVTVGTRAPRDGDGSEATGVDGDGGRPVDGPDAEDVRTRSLLFLQQWDAGMRSSLGPPGPGPRPAAPHNSLHHPPSWGKLHASGAWVRRPVARWGQCSHGHRVAIAAVDYVPKAPGQPVDNEGKAAAPAQLRQQMEGLMGGILEQEELQQVGAQAA